MKWLPSGAEAAVSVAAGEAGDRDSEALVRVRMALELQLRNGFGIRPIRSS